MNRFFVLIFKSFTTYFFQGKACIITLLIKNENIIIFLTMIIIAIASPGVYGGTKAAAGAIKQSPN